MLPFRPTGTQKAVTLLRSNFTPAPTDATGRALLSGVMSPLAYRDVPIGSILSLRGGQPFRMYLMGVMGIQNSGPATQNDLPFNTSSIGATLTRSTRAAPAFPTPAHPDIRAQITNTDTLAVMDGSIVAFDFATGAGSVRIPAGNPNVFIRIFYLTADGEMEIRAARPLGSDGLSAKIYGAPIRALHETDQNNMRTAPTFGTEGSAILLPERYRLSINVRSKENVVWLPNSGTEVVIAADSLPVVVTNAARMNAEAEVRLRGGSI